LVSGPFYGSLHGTILHGVHHAGQIALFETRSMICLACSTSRSPS